MRILNDDNDAAVDQVILYLTEKETRILLGYLEQLLESPERTHFHLEDLDSGRLLQEITVTLVREEQLHEFGERAQKLWLTGK